jgi:protein O-mannosyl-transferase
MRWRNVVCSRLSMKEQGFTFWKSIAAAAILLVVGLLTYSPSFDNGFVYDDEVYVLANPLVKGNLQLTEIFTKPYPPDRPDQGLYRPLVTLSYFIDGKLWDFAPTGRWNGFHFTNAVIHSMNAILLFFVLGRLGTSFRMASAATLLFVVHPVLTESVGWVVGRAELLGTFFALCGFLSFLCRPNGFGYVLALFFWLLALLNKETWVFFPIAVLAAYVCFPKAFQTTWGRNRLIISWLGAFALFAAFWWMRSQVIGSWKPSLVAYQDVVTPFQRIATAAGLMWRYLTSWLWPVNLSVHHEIRPVTEIRLSMGIFLSWLFVFGLMIRAKKYFPWFTFALLWFWLLMLPVSNLLIPIGAVFAERFLYASTLFFAPALCMGIQLFCRMFQKHRIIQSPWPKYFVIAALSLFSTSLIWSRLHDWETNTTLWESTLKKYPNSTVVKAALAEAYLKEGRFADAHVLAGEASVEMDSKPVAYQKLFVPKITQLHASAQSGMRQLAWAKKFNEANALAREQRTQEALEAYRKLIEDAPEQAPTYEALGDLYVRLQNPIAAQQNYEEALRLGMNHAAIWSKYAQTMSGIGRYDGALMAYDKALSLNPEDAVALYNRGVVLAGLGEYSDALDSFNKAVKITPLSVAPRLNAVAILVHQKRYEEAKKEIGMILSINPQQKDALELLAKIPNAIHPAQPPPKK